MLTAIGLPLLHRLDDTLTAVHGYVRRWRAVLDPAADWRDLEQAGCDVDPACGGAA